MTIVANLTDAALAEYIGPAATPEHARLLRRYLTAAGYSDTKEVPDDAWNRFVEWADRGSRQRPWRIVLRDGSEHAVPPSINTDRFGCGAVVEWARSAGLVSADMPIRTIVDGSGAEITQF